MEYVFAHLVSVFWCIRLIDNRGKLFNVVAGFNCRLVYSAVDLFFRGVSSYITAAFNHDHVRLVFYFFLDFDFDLRKR